MWWRPLCDDWRTGLCAEPEHAQGRSPPGGSDEADWAERESGGSPPTDGRLRRCLVALGRAWLASLSPLLPPPDEATVARGRTESFVLAIQDTPTLQDDGGPAPQGLDERGGGGQGTQGIGAQAGMAVNGAGRFLGWFTGEADCRRATGPDRVRWPAGLTPAPTWAQAGPDTRVVSGGDREGDCWAWLQQADEIGAERLGRAARGAKRRVRPDDGAEEDGWDHGAQWDPVGSQRLSGVARGGPRGHSAAVTLTGRCGRVSLVPTKEVGGEPLTVLAVSAREASPRPGMVPLEWGWLTPADEAPDQTSARPVLRWVERRGLIERCFHALKVGPRIEDRRLDETNDGRQGLAFDAITAFRVWDGMRLARERPDDPAGRQGPPSECRGWLARARPLRLPGSRGPPDTLTLQTWVVLTAGLAGGCPSQRQPMPGTQKLWPGLQLLKGEVIGDEWGPQAQATD